MDAYFKAIAQRGKWRVLGADLLPLTVGHLFLLRSYCPAALEDQSWFNFGEVALAVFICSNDQSKVEALLARKLAPIMFRIWGWLCRKKSLIDARVVFDSYLTAHQEAPKIWADLHKPILSSEAPLEIRLLAMLMEEFHCSPSEAMATEVTRANALWSVLGEKRGNFEFEGERRRALFAFRDEMEAKAKAQNAGSQN